MRLTKHDREVFVRTVMDDVPQVDYVEQARSLFNKWAIEALPEDLRAAYEKHPDHFQHWYSHTPFGAMYSVMPADWKGHGFGTVSPEKFSQMKQLAEKRDVQERALAALKSKVIGLIESCATLKIAKERLPEFEKYLPAERGVSTTANLPVANTLADLCAAGWPKDKPLAQGAQA